MIAASGSGSTDLGAVTETMVPSTTWMSAAPCQAESTTVPPLTTSEPRRRSREALQIFEPASSGDVDHAVGVDRPSPHSHG